MSASSTSSPRGRLNSAFATFGAVLDVARAVEAKRIPPKAALKTLGLAEEHFRQIRYI